MKRIFVFLALVSVIFVISCESGNEDVLSGNDNSGIDKGPGLHNLPFLDLNVDQVVPGGLTQATINNMLNTGWELGTLNEIIGINVEFENAGGIYLQEGLIAAGETILIHSVNEEAMLAQCGNKTREWSTGGAWGDTCEIAMLYQVVTIHQ